MKKLILLALFTVISIGNSFSQESTKEENNLTYYVAAGLSVTNSSNFSDSSYFSVEGGVMYDNLQAGLVFGRNNLTNTFVNDSFENYWVEAKVAPSFNVGYVDAYFVAGLGTYLGNGDVFIEYGLGLYKEISDNVGVFTQVSSWDGTVYFTPGLSYSF